MNPVSGSIARSAVTGAVAGLAGAWCMNQFQALWSKAASGLVRNQKPSQAGGEDATVKTAKAISENIFQHKLTEDEKKWTGPAVHYTFGSIVGAAYGVLAETVPMSRAGFGTAYGTGVWLFADEIGVPAAGLSESSLKYPLSSHVKALASHLVYGLATELARRTLTKAYKP
jgi:hypothetical protein